ncbi:PTS galactosamine/N-acetylgalactosamine transporter subunit IIA [Clostridium polynesiense]|uniref:PTS galactosamine/N-acetylgalactosamine transporter subunit IIA n=1 Tax=Clostridium polynesiense TaxID=1325933 RepID=UPI00058B6E2A|nr:PTS galactosamine/N-acetylgalactosamine transporter subunit IIA [Clostridium polynesiense]
MIGIILVGHGSFASGLESSVKLIAGEQKNFISIDFLQELTGEMLEDEIKKALNELKDCDSLIIFTDILGGTPFKTAAKYVNDKVKLITGTNLSMVIEASLFREMNKELNEIVEGTMSSGREQIREFTIKATMDEDF